MAPSPTVRLPPPTRLENQILRTYIFMRVGIAGLAFAFPIMLYARGHFWAHLPLLPSMSDYYAAGRGIARDFFVGTLWAVGFVLIVYQGYSVLENLLLDAAGFLAIGIALFPKDSRANVHNFCAITFFACIVLVSLFCAHDTVPLLRDRTKERFYSGVYYAIAVIMLASLLTVMLLRDRIGQYIFVAELFGIYSFSAYWFAKTAEIYTSDADRHAVHGTIQRKGGKIVQREPPPQ